ncbi:hypothetical protein C7974DRAFT_370557 [Boeremia exigua]|uniref:uncharacterized protein n=1 Tax=Boeremia exigua TaxID=749465 RepID=UPI001E8D6A9A|nr:uncharacterized protein C7974DRAFT_370557 [Boeremia exigua]KAH6612118.1 hypothetical protein C7974DRAFT_370557 [Boeremia exigua]
MTPSIDLINVCESPVQTGDSTVQQLNDPIQTQKLTREAERQTHFQKISNGVFEVPNGYRKVEVTIIRWHEQLDEFKGHGKEIEELKTIFVDLFGFNCHIVELCNDKSPQIELEYAILSQVRNFPDDDTLNIFYYTGHGIKVEGPNGPRLQLAATRNWIPDSRYPPTAFWDDAERPLLSQVRCDVLTILDCCYAGTAALKGDDEGSRSYQMLTASPPDGNTRGPGSESFTHALCVSLRQMLQEADGGTFRVDQLCEKINLTRLTHASLHWSRMSAYGHIINLSRLEKTKEREKSFAKRDVEKASLLLRLYLKNGDLTNPQIERLARKLPQACKEAKIPVVRIAWVDMDELKPGRRFQHLVRDVVKRNNSTPDTTQTSVLQSGSKKRNRSDPAPATSKRPALGNMLAPTRRLSPRLSTPDSLSDK